MVFMPFSYTFVNFDQNILTETINQNIYCEVFEE